MPSPPPPSASYLLKFDSDSEEEEEVAFKKDISIRAVETFRHVETRPSEPNVVVKAHPKEEDRIRLAIPKGMMSVEKKKQEEDPLITASEQHSTKKEEDRIRVIQEAEEPSKDPVVVVVVKQEEEEEEDEEEAANEPTAASSPKKKRKRKRHRKKKSSPPSKPRSVHFGVVSIRLYPRLLHEGGGVPADGGWPLGMSYDKFESQAPIALEEYEAKRARDLQERYRKLVDKTGSKIPAVLETRQFDYKKSYDANGRSVKNPLFFPLRENERMDLLLDEPAKKKTGSEQQQPTRKNSRRASRKKTFPSSLSSSSSSLLVCADDETYDSTFVRQVRNGLEQIRASRAGEMGCTCRKLNVYIPPQHSGKKAQHKRLSERRVKEELRKRNQLPTQRKTRQELEILLAKRVEEEPCCLADCVCSKNGLSCHADTCGCWHGSHQTKTTVGNHDVANDAKQSEASSDPSPEEIRSRCGNRNGMYVVDVDAIHEYREGMLCKVIGQ